MELSGANRVHIVGGIVRHDDATWSPQNHQNQFSIKESFIIDYHQSHWFLHSNRTSVRFALIAHRRGSRQYQRDGLPLRSSMLCMGIESLQEPGRNTSVWVRNTSVLVWKSHLGGEEEVRPTVEVEVLEQVGRKKRHHRADKDRPEQYPAGRAECTEDCGGGDFA